MGRLLARNFSGPSIKFDGTSTEIVAANPVVTPSQLTMLAWVNKHDYLAYRYMIASVAGGNFRLGFDNNENIICYPGGGTSVVTTGKPIKLRSWSHIAATCDSSGTKIYLNGALHFVSATAITSTTFTPQIGSDGAATSSGSYIAEPAIFNRALTAEEIRAIYEQGPVAYPQDGSCVLDYRFKEGAINGATIVDSSGKGNHGTLTLGSGRIDPYNIPVPNRVVIPGNMPLVAMESTGVNAIYVLDTAIAAAFGVAAGQVGVNGLSIGSWVKNKKYAVQPYFISKGSYNNYGSYLAMTSSKALAITSNGSGTNYSLNINSATQVSWNNLAAINGIDHYKAAVNGLLSKKQYVSLVGHGSVSLSIISTASGNITAIAMPFIANRILTDEEIYNIYSKAVFPADVLFWHGADSTGTKIMCHKGSYGNRPAEVIACDATLGSGNYFTDDCPWK